MCAHGRVLAEPRLSPDGRLVAFVSSALGRGQIVVAPVDGGHELVVTSDPPPRPVAAYGGGAFDWAGSDCIVYAAVDGGLWSVSVAGGPPTQVVAPSADQPASGPAVSPDGRWVAYMVDSRDIAIAPLDGGEWPRQLSNGADFGFDPCWRADGSAVAWHEWDVPNMPWDTSRLRRRTLAGEADVATVFEREDVQVQQPRFAPQGDRMGFLTDADGYLNLWVADGGGEARPLVKEPYEHGDPSWGPGQRSFAWSPDGNRIAFTRNEGGFGRLCVVDLTSGDVAEVATGVHGALSWRGAHIAAVRSGARTPSQVVVYDTATGARRTVARGPLAGFESAGLIEPELVEWPGDDGGVVHGRLYRPAHSASGQDPPPLIAFVHGGPTSQWPVGFIPRFAFWLARGWAILVPDHRGSTGHGRAYMTAMRGRWGDLDTSDVAAGLRAAATHGWADARRMVVMGGSAGGFTVLNVLARHPDLCAAGVDLYGVTDLLDLDETTHRFEKHYLHSIVGPLPDAVDRYRANSPMNVADRITAPLLILQGAADVVVPPAQSEAIAARLRALGRTVELHLYEGEGHGWLRPETVMDELTRTEDFLRRHVLRWRA